MANQDVTGSGNITGGRDATVTTSSSDGGDKGPVKIIGGIIAAVIIALSWAWQAGILPWTGEPDPVEQVPVEVETLPAPDVGARMPPPPSSHACSMCGIDVDCEGEGWGEAVCGSCGQMPTPPMPTGPSPDACPICGLKIKHFPKDINGSTRLVLGADCDGDGWGELICGPCADAKLPYPSLANL